MALMLLFGSVAAAEAGERRKLRMQCPLCDDSFTFRIVPQELRTGLRLDFKQFGNQETPAPLPECRKCDFVLVDAGHGELSSREIELLRELVGSERYEAAREETSYFRLAVALEKLGRPPEEIAFAYVAASWQVDESVVRCQIYLARALAWYETYLAQSAAISAARVRAMLLKAEILRRLGRFAEAEEFLADLAYHPAMKHPMEQNIIQQQRDLVAAQDDEPHVAIADDARVEVSLAVITPGARSIRPALRPDVRLPTFPSGPYASRVSGSVTLQLSVTRSGYIAGWKVKSASAEVFARSVLRSVHEWTFVPELLDGAPSPVQMECTVHFGLEG